MSERSFGDYRYDGHELRELYEFVHSGAGPQGVARAAGPLRDLANALEQVDDDLRHELRPLGVEWTGTASEELSSASDSLKAFLGAATDPTTASSSSAEDAAQAFATTRDTVPEPGTFSPSSTTDLVLKMSTPAGLALLVNDLREFAIAEHERTETARRTMNTWQQTASSTAMGLRPLSEPPRITVNADQVHPLQPPVPKPPPDVPPPGEPSQPPGGGGRDGGDDSGGGQQPTVPAPTPPAAPTPPSAPGPVPGSPYVPQPPPGQPPGAGPGAPWPQPLAPGPVGPGSGSNAGRSALAGRGTGSGIRGGPGDGAGSRSSTPGIPGVRGGPTGGAAAGTGAGRGAGGFMAPAAGRGGQGAEDDKDHTDRYWVDDDDLFRDDRRFVPPVIGAEPPRQQP